jgi:hypothetical protein
MNIVCYNSFLMEQRQYGFYFVGNLPHDSAAAEMAGMVGKLVGAEVRVMSSADPLNVQSIGIELQPGEDYLHQNLAKRINKSFGRDLLNGFAGFWDIGGNSVVRGGAADMWKRIGFWTEIVTQGLTSQEEEFISTALQAFPKINNLQMIRDDSVEYQVNKYKMPMNTAKFWKDALESQKAQARKALSLDR